tara:strand:- start:63 stop:569 length:507 start_codon:yes stop_codon:yes gene_type:complete
MARKIKQVYKSYIENNQRYMICRNSVEGGKYWKGKLCGNWVKVGPKVTAVLCSSCVNKVVDPPKFTPRYKPTGRPKGWQWMKEYVDKDGNVFHKGKEQPQLKGKLSPTKIVPKKAKKRLTKRERESIKRTQMAELYDLKKKLSKAKLKKDKKPLEVQIRKLSRKLRIK